MSELSPNEANRQKVEHLRRIWIELLPDAPLLTYQDFFWLLEANTYRIAPILWAMTKLHERLQRRADVGSYTGWIRACTKRYTVHNSAEVPDWMFPEQHERRRDRDRFASGCAA
jgi:hypothetical protein